MGIGPMVHMFRGAACALQGLVADAVAVLMLAEAAAGHDGLVDGRHQSHEPGGGWSGHAEAQGLWQRQTPSTAIIASHHGGLPGTPFQPDIILCCSLLWTLPAMQEGQQEKFHVCWSYEH